MRADLPCPLRLLDGLSRLADFCLGQKPLPCSFAVHLDSPRGIAGGRAQAEINAEIDERPEGGDRVIGASRYPGHVDMQPHHVVALDAGDR